MKTIIASASLLLLLSACGDVEGDQASDDDAVSAGAGSGGGATSAAPVAPDAIPAADGPVRSRWVATVMDVGDGPELCLGAIAESYPPQCGGPEIIGWDWAAQRPNFERQGEIRWGTFAVTGTWDGTAFTITDAVPGALYDPMPEPPTPLPEPSVDLTEGELTAISDELTTTLPGAQSAYPDQEGHVLVDVMYDDGSLQTYVDEVYGSGVVVVTGALVDA